MVTIKYITHIISRYIRIIKERIFYSAYDILNIILSRICMKITFLRKKYRIYNQQINSPRVIPNLIIISNRYIQLP